MTASKLVALIIITALAGVASGEEIRVSAGELENLGIRFVSPVRVDEVAATEATARVVIPPAGEAVVGTPQSGLLTGLHVAVGDDVASGQVLAGLSSPEFLSLQGEFLDALNRHRLARNELERDRQLHEEGIISARRLQETSTRARIAETSLDEHRQLLRIAGITGSDLEALESGQQLKESLEIRAPFAGVIVERMATTGQRLDAMSPIYRLADLSELWLEINVQQEQVAGIRTGMTVTGPANAFTGRITTIGRAIDPHTQSITVRAVLFEGAQSLSPGQFVAVQLIAAGDAGDGFWAVPAAAVTRSSDGYYLFVQVPGGVEVRRVEVVSVSAERAWLGTRLDPGDRVAISGISALKAMWAASDDSET